MRDGGHVWELRERVYELLLAGCSGLAVSRETGVARNTIVKWVRATGLTLELGGRGGIVGAPMSTQRPVVGGPWRSYRRLTLADRSFIAAARVLVPPVSMREIAKRLGVAPSTVSRELSLHQVTHRKWDRYIAELAHRQALVARTRRVPLKLDRGPLRGEVVSRLKTCFSPQQIAGQLRREFPGQEEMWVSHETIYQALYVQGKGALRHELTVEKALRSGRTTRLPQSRLPKKSSRPWLDGARLSDRPAEANDRAVPGHWEGDLVVGPENSGLVTLVERAHRFALIGRLPAARDSKTVTDVLAGMIEDLPTQLKRSITWDQGTEMASHAQFTVRTGCPVYFCDPHSPWQRGSNENLNGLIRDFYPKGTNFNHVTDEEIAHMQWLLNIRPRQTLSFQTPAQALDEYMTSVAIAT